MKYEDKEFIIRLLKTELSHVQDDNYRNSGFNICADERSERIERLIEELSNELYD